MPIGFLRRRRSSTARTAIERSREIPEQLAHIDRHLASIRRPLARATGASAATGLVDGSGQPITGDWYYVTEPGTSAVIGPFPTLLQYNENRLPAPTDDLVILDLGTGPAIVGYYRHA